ncbi:hypothetical protein H0G86_011871 [Trichoderma simmonsii]|uniref:Uncharacterized protein n=1 Tax=Trichoderma simmonsii TaxID=1491479 RepID=A0A8G0LP98_9HYPO|nr:hypothetical protein H0G86_011871 [Trichoderma simmonsii]
MADNTQNESGNRSSGISSGIIEKGVAIPGPDLPLMVRSGDSAANRRKARKAKKGEDMEMDLDIEGGCEGDFESNIRSSGMSSGIVEKAVAVPGSDLPLMVQSGDVAANRRKARNAKGENQDSTDKEQ